MKLLALSTVLVVVSSSVLVANGQYQCQGEGFFVDPNDCSKFIRCVDTYQSGRFQVYNFDCPDGKFIIIYI